MLFESDEDDVLEEINIPKEFLKRKPKEPNEEDCCGNGCKLCVFDIFKQEMKMWKDECRNRCSTEHESQLGQNNNDTFNPKHYNSFQLTKITPISKDINVYKFLIPGKKSLGGIAVQHLIARGYIKDQCITRQYTPVSNLDVKGYFDVLIKIYEEGLMSEYIKTWNLGNMVEWRGPFTQFSYVSNQYKSLLMLAAGTGIAPMIQIIRSILENDSDDTRIHLVFCCKNYESILMKRFLDQCKEYWNFNVLYCLNQENNQTQIKYGENVIFGKINETVLKQKLRDILDIENNLLLICGPKSFNEDTKKIAMEELEINIENIFIF